MSEFGVFPPSSVLRRRRRRLCPANVVVSLKSGCYQGNQLKILLVLVVVVAAQPYSFLYTRYIYS